MQNSKKTSGFTLVELLVALSVSSIILAAVATLGYAFGRGYESMSDTSGVQAQVRYATMRISELIRHSRMVCYADSECFALWQADENDDGQINIGELVYLDKGTEGNYVRVWSFSSGGTAVELNTICSVSTGWWMAYGASAEDTVIVSECSNVQFDYHDALPPDSRFVTVSFELAEKGGSRQYEVSAGLRATAGNLLNDAVDAIVDDDD